MAAHEPYVSDPAEPRYPTPSSRLRAATTLAIMVLLAAALTYGSIQGRGELDPSLQVPVEAPDQ